MRLTHSRFPARVNAIGILLLTLLCGSSLAGMVALDSFTEGDYTLSLPGGSIRDGVELASTVRHNAAIRLVAPEAAIRADRQSSQGSLDFSYTAATDPPEEDNYNWLMLKYSGLDLREVDGFLLDFESMYGSGELLVNYNNRDGAYLPSMQRLDLTSAGLVYYPAALVNGLDTASANSFVQFVFVTQSAEFGFTLNEITIVPEPATVSFLLFGVGLLLIRKRRTVHWA
jgi:8-oxo-dGTP pyrophosphatase MutT (NUDIX family)